MGTDYSNYTLSKDESVKMVTLLVLALAVIGYVFYKSLVPAAFAVILYKPCKRTYEKYMAKKLRGTLRTQFKDFLYCISASFATGRHMGESLKEAKHELGKMYSKDDAIMMEIDSMLHMMRETGAADIEVLEDFAKRAGIEDVSDFVQVFKACRETGGDMITSLNKSAAVIGEKITIENDIRVIVAQKKYEGRIITAMPLVIIVFLRIMSPDYLSVMYETLMGRILMTSALACTLAAYILIERITDIEV